MIFFGMYALDPIFLGSFLLLLLLVILFIRHIIFLIKRRKSFQNKAFFLLLGLLLGFLAGNILFVLPKSNLFASYRASPLIKLRVDTEEVTDFHEINDPEDKEILFEIFDNRQYIRVPMSILPGSPKQLRFTIIIPADDQHPHLEIVSVKLENQFRQTYVIMGDKLFVPLDQNSFQNGLIQTLNYIGIVTE